MPLTGTKIFRKYIEAKQAHPDIDEWLSTSISMEYPEDSDAIQAAMLCFTTDMPWESWRVFEKIAVVINGRPMIGDLSQELCYREIAYAVHTLKQQFPNDTFNDEVCKMLAYELSDDGLVIAPHIMDFVQPFLPIVYLSKEQEKMQGAYLQEAEDYIRLMEGNR